MRSPVRSLVIAAVVGLTTTIFACGGGSDHRVDSARATAESAAAAVRPARTDSGCAHTGRWDFCSVEERLAQAGLAPQRLPDSVRHAFLTVAGIRYRIGAGELQAFVYRDADRATRDARAMDTVRVAAPDETPSWPLPATFIRSSNLVAILLSANDHQIERVRDALTAGLPAPSR